MKTELKGNALTVIVTTLSAKADSFLGHARTLVPRYVPNAPSERKNMLRYFTGLDFTQKPNFCNHLSKLLKNFGEQTFESILLLAVYSSPVFKILYNNKEVDCNSSVA